MRAFVDWLAKVFDKASGMVRVAPLLTDPPAWPVLDPQRLHGVDAASHCGALIMGMEICVPLLSHCSTVACRRALMCAS
ncbi:hypothetical protein [Paraburkholderia sp. RL17-337-BIB-A]|uniref:hypothetical protein n=1 Tax=Paraburkholderia sp. RL17-337-BIB-A TaxID=3031636 RepID=UPI0038B873B4